MCVKLIELNCKNCGAKLKAPEGTTQLDCKFCGSSFNIEDAYSDGYKYTKGVLKAQSEQMKENFEKMKGLMKNSPFGKISKVISILFVIIFVSVFVFIIYNIFRNFGSESDFNINLFNSKYEFVSGKKTGISISHTLDDIVTNNKKNKDHKITVIYKDITSNEELKIKEIRDKLSDWTDYDVSLNYDNSGYVNKITIKDL